MVTAEQFDNERDFENTFKILNKLDRYELTKLHILRSIRNATKCFPETLIEDWKTLVEQ